MNQNKENNANILDAGPFYHGTKADLKQGDLLVAGYCSNYGKRQKANFVYFSPKFVAKYIIVCYNKL